PLELYFDRNSGLLFRELRFAETPLGLNPTRIDFSDYADFDGVKVARHLLIAGPGRRLEIQFEDIKQNLPVDDAVFEHQYSVTSPRCLSCRAQTTAVPPSVRHIPRPSW